MEINRIHKVQADISTEKADIRNTLTQYNMQLI